MIVKMAESDLQTEFGNYREILFYNGQKDAVALVMGEVAEGEQVFCRVHSSCLNGHYFNSLECDCREQMAVSQKLIQEAGKGIIIWLDQEGKGNGHFALLKSKPYKMAGLSQSDAYEAAGFRSDHRDFSSAAKILNYLKVKSVRMLTGNPEKVATLQQYGINVAGTKALDSEHEVDNSRVYRDKE